MGSERDIQKKKEDLLKEIREVYGGTEELKEEAEELATEESSGEAPAENTEEEKPSEKKSEESKAVKDSEKKEEKLEESDGEESLELDDLSDLEEETSFQETKTSQPLPKWGEGGKFVPIVLVVTIIAIVAGHLPYIKYGIPNPKWVRYTYIFIGVVFLFFGIKMIADAVSECAIFENIMLGKLVTTGIYSKTRNPMYGGIIIACTGALFISGNAFMYVLPVAYWGFLSVYMKRTEEVILKARFGEKYIDYRNHVNLFIPRKQEPEKDIIKFIFDKKNSK